MKIMMLVLGMSLYGTVGIARQDNNCCEHKNHEHPTTGIREIYPDFEAKLRAQSQSPMLDVSSLEIFHVEEEIDLDFDPAAYLPEGFDPYAGRIAAWVDLGLTEIEEELDPDLGFDPAPYLPAGFDPYAGKIATWVDLGLHEVEEEQALDLGFDTAPYLPAGFDPYQGMKPNTDQAVQ